MVVTNQAGIARGFYTEADYQQLMQWMRGEFRREGVELDAVYPSPYHPIHGVGEYKREHEDRKPGTGMLRRGAKEFGLDLTQSILVATAAPTSQPPTPPASSRRSSWPEPSPPAPAPALSSR